MSGSEPSDGWNRREERAAQPVPPTPSPQPAYVVAPTNGLAIAALVCGIVWLGGLGSILALVLGYTARSQIDRSDGRESGRGLAVVAIVLGWIGVAGFLFLVLGLGCVASVGVDDGGELGPVIIEP